MATENTIPELHHFPGTIHHIALPEKFTCPFHYSPHPLSILAATAVQSYLNSRHDWQQELQQGKMFGVLTVQDLQGEIGFLAAFSGILAGSYRHAYFVPPVYDLQQPEGFFKAEETNISALNTRIQELETAPAYRNCKQMLAQEQLRSQQLLQKDREKMAADREKREKLRQQQPDEAQLSAMIRESQYQKAEFKRLKLAEEKRLTVLRAELTSLEDEIEQLKAERKKRSAALQQKLFKQFRLRNARGDIRDLCTIFRETVQKTPPAGAGECAAPKLLQYAFIHRLKPIAMAEFWWGGSPKTELRRHGYYYPACAGKCGPILGFMLQGLDVDDNPLLHNEPCRQEPEILFEDKWLLVVNKPAGMLSVPGKSGQMSVYQLMKSRYPEASGPMIVHRLDMATSGLLVIAKTKEVHRQLQTQFKNHSVEKRYVALLDGILTGDEGCIDLPLCPDPQDRPRQIVSYQHGKPAITRYKVIERRRQHTLIAFYPVTGRTHQLRVHAAHPQGLNMPITGDPLYGRPAQRLCLHAEQITFRHPVTGENITVEKKGISECF